MTQVLPASRRFLRVETFRELHAILAAFAQGHYDLLVLFGPPGVAKSELTRRAMQAKHGKHWGLIAGKHTPLGLYEQLYRHRHHDIVLDDLDGLVKNPDNVALLKALCDTRPVKRIAWASQHSVFRAREQRLPKAFDSISRVAILCNDWARLSRNLMALEDRGFLLKFHPSAVEVHREVATGGWFNDPEVFEFIGRHLHLVVEPSMRMYVNVERDKRAGMPWREFFFRSLASDHGEQLMLVAHLLADAAFSSESDRVAAFEQRSKQSRATYFRHKRKLELLDHSGGEVVEPIQLQPLRPDALMVLAREHREFLEQQGREEADVLVGPPSKPAASSRTARQGEVKRLRRALKRAIEAEEFERAAELREQLRQLDVDDSSA